MYNYIIKSPNYYKVGLYIRLSLADEDKAYEAESESIINQRNLLTNYVKQNGFTLIDEYVDDGYTGTNFERPGFNKLINDIEIGKINCVITKDLSRLGRDYIKCGYYVENYFPKMKVRYISILDGIDTYLESANNDIAPFKALFNDMTSKDTSKKIRSILKSKKEQGKFIGSEPSYGYMRDPLDKGHLIPNPEYAIVVKKIFEMAYQGVGISNITTYLNSMNYTTPSILKRKNPESKAKVNDKWTISSVNKILKNRMYTGDMVQNVQTKLSYKSKKKVSLEKDFWIIVENTHEPLVSKAVFNSIQNNSRREKRTFNNREKRLLENLIYCKECGNTLTVSYRKNKNYWTVNCNKYSRDPKRRLCEPHFMPYDKLECEVISKIKNTCKKYFDDLNTKEIAEEIIKANNPKINNKEKIQNIEKRIAELKDKQDLLYEDKFNNIITVDMYLRLSKKVEIELNNLESELKEYKDSSDKVDKEDINNCINKLKQMIDIENPTRNLLSAIINKIVIDKDKNIEIIYNFKFMN